MRLTTVAAAQAAGERVDMRDDKDANNVAGVGVLVRISQRFSIVIVRKRNEVVPDFGSHIFVDISPIPATCQLK